MANEKNFEFAPNTYPHLVTPGRWVKCEESEGCQLLDAQRNSDIAPERLVDGRNLLANYLAFAGESRGVSHSRRGSIAYPIAIVQWVVFKHWRSIWVKNFMDAGHRSRHGNIFSRQKRVRASAVETSTGGVASRRCNPSCITRFHRILFCFGKVIIYIELCDAVGQRIRGYSSRNMSSGHFTWPWRGWKIP